MSAPVDLDRLTIGTIVSSLTLRQLLSVGAFLLAIGSAGFTLGGYWPALTGGSTAADTAHQLAVARDQLALLQLKERILGLSVLYFDAAAAKDEETRAHALDLGRSLFQVVMENARASEAASAKPPVRLRIGKGIVPRITFEADNTTYPLPPALFAAAN